MSHFWENNDDFVEFQLRKKRSDEELFGHPYRANSARAMRPRAHHPLPPRTSKLNHLACGGRRALVSNR
jgi:hypothetical protein